MLRNPLPIVRFQGSITENAMLRNYFSQFKFFFASSFGPSWLRKLVSDFAVILAIIIMVLIDMYLGPGDTPKLFVPDTFKPTRNDRGNVFYLKGGHCVVIYE